MSGLGYHSPLPLRLGGGPSPVESIYKHLRACVGNGFSGEDGTIEAYWRWARARAMWAACDDERAAMQAFPERATDCVPMYEQILGLQPAGRDMESRRQAISSLWYAAAYGDNESLETDLQAIDSRFSILSQTDTASATTEAGRAFEDYTPATYPAFGGGRSETALPNFSHRFRVYVLLDMGAGVPSLESQTKIAQAESLLNKRLPAWVDYRIGTNTGFILDLDVLDAGTFGT